jgi:hypothetical protein
MAKVVHATARNASRFERGVPVAAGEVVEVERAAARAGKGESTFTTSVNVTFTDGTRISFHEVSHVLFDANGVVKVEFDKFKAHCG